MATTNVSPTMEQFCRVDAIHKLRVNLKSLIGESRIIRFEERRAGEIYRGSLHRHRVIELREEIRITGLALAFVRKKPYSVVEVAHSKPIDVVRLAKKVRGKYNAMAFYRDGVECTMEVVLEWIQGK